MKKTIENSTKFFSAVYNNTQFLYSGIAAAVVGAATLGALRLGYGESAYKAISANKASFAESSWNYFKINQEAVAQSVLKDAGLTLASAALTFPAGYVASVGLSAVAGAAGGIYGIVGDAYDYFSGSQEEASE
ncbi:MAG: hypothetical protein SFT93_04465 [Rickettsiaceae bacterium]|nr:hypothetical protein [Rickettsiaceae bacterium]